MPSTSHTARRSFHGRLSCAALLLASSACTEAARAPTQLTEPTDARTFVTPELAASLDPRGFFVLPEMTGDPARITATRAAELAEKEVTTFEHFNRSYLESQRGAPIDFAALRVEPRIYFAESPYVQDIPADVHPAVRKYTGPYYLVTLSDLTGPVLSVAVSAYDTDVTIVNDRVMLPPYHGGDFRVQAVRVSNGAGLPVSPEHAARIAAQSLGAAISKTPELLLPNSNYVPQYARWRLELDRAVSVRGTRTGRVSSVQTVYVGLGGQLSIPVDDASSSSDRPTALTRTDPLSGRAVPQHLRPATPIAFEPIDQ
jgi:hypothetical protein